MENIKKYFIKSMVDPINHSIDNAINVNDININNINHEFIDIASNQDSNNNLIRKIQILEEENDRLLSIIKNKNNIIKNKLKYSCNSASDYKNEKVLQLTKTVQELMSELQAIKSMASDVNQKKKEETIVIKRLTNKLKLSNKRNCNYRNQIIQIKNNLKITQNALSNEIGDPVLTQAILSRTDSSNYKGRAQKIFILQQRVKELQGKKNDQRLKDMYTSTEIRQMEKTRKLINDQALKDNELKVNELSKSLNIWKSRSKALDVEITILRVRLQKLLTKSEFDTQQIDKLKSKLSSYNHNNNNNNNIKQFKFDEQIKLLQSKIEKAENIIKQQESALNDKDIKITHLEATVINYSKQIPNQNIHTIDFLDPKEIFIRKLKTFENQQLRDLLCAAHNQICEQVKADLDFKNKYLMEKQKLHKFKLKTGFLDPSATSKNKLNISYNLKNTLNPNEKLIELQNKLELTEVKNVALKEKLDTLIMINKENVQTFVKSLNNMK